MAIIQISKIQQRTGNLVDLPQLDEAEFGWATDAKRLFIGKSVPNENIEVLTSYSNISFSQVTGAGGSNLNIVAPLNGQVLSYVSSTNTWQNSGSTGGGLINLGNVSNVQISGGAIGYVLQTDGTGNLTWASKGTITANIIALSNATPIVMQVATSIPYTNGTAITISGVNGAANSNVNSKIFYVKVATDFPTSGNVTLYTDSVLSTAAVGTSLTYTNSPNALATTSVGGGGATSANGSTYSVQFNNSGIISGDSNITWDFNNRIFSVNGNANITGNINGTANIVGSRLVSNIATGTTPLVVTSTTRVANLNVATSGVANTVNDAAQGNITSVGTLTSLNSSGNITAPIIAANTNGTGNNFKVGDDAWIGDINVTNTMVIKGQQDGANGYIIFGTGDTTSTLGRAGTGALTYNGAFSSVGNANVGNLGTGGLITATGNIRGANLVTPGVLSVTGNANVGNLGTAGVIVSSIATGTAPFTIASTTKVTNLNADLLDGYDLASAATNSTVVLRSADGSVFANIFYGVGNNLSNIQGANVSGQVGNALVAGTVYTAAQPNITSTGILTSVSVSGNANIGNIGTGGLITATGNLNAGNIITGGIVSATGNITGGNLTLANASTITTGANTNIGYFTGNWQLTAGSRMTATYADLAEYYEADQHYEPATVLEFGGDKEVTLATDGTARVAGVVSTDPAYAMNANCQGIATPIALQGRVPTKVRGTVRKGDMMISAGDGYARPSLTPHMGTVIGKALENFDGIEGVIEVAVGRL